MSESAATKAGKAATATASAEIGTILVVAPRNERFNYSRQDDLIINTGNVSFRVIAYGVCKDPLRTGAGMPGTLLRYAGTKIRLQKAMYQTAALVLAFGMASNLLQ